MFELGEDEGGLLVAWNGAPLMGYSFGLDVGRPHWHPLRLPDSPALTWNQPPDHPHHHGMWLAWKKVNGVNFWERPGGGDWSGFGRIVHREVTGTSAGARSARFSARSDWIDWRGTLQLCDTRQTTVHAPGKDGLVVELFLRLTAAARPVTLDLARGTPGEFGIFYSGLTVRFAESFRDCRLLDSEGRTTADAIYGARARWCGLSGVCGADGRAYGIIIVDSSENPRHPTPWWVRNRPGYALVQPSICYEEPIELAPGGSLDLSYVVVIHEGHVRTELAGRLPD